MPKISIITVCKDAEQFIEKTILSVISQTFKEYEYIIIDGSSTDGTLDIIKKYEDKVDKFISEEDKGIYDAMNKGIDLASGEYIIFLNTGDYFITKNILQDAMNYRADADILYGDGLVVFKEKKLIRKPSPKNISSIFMFADTLPHQDSLIRKSLFDSIGNFDDKMSIAADYDFFLRALYEYNASTEYIPIPIAVNNLTGVSNQSKYKNIKGKERVLAQDRYLDKNKLKYFRLFKPFLFLFYKYPKYIYFIFRSLISTKYLKIYNESN